MVSEDLDALPKVRKLKVVVASSDHRYLRTPNEVRRFLAAARDEGEPVFEIYAAALWTGMRLGELVAISGRRTVWRSLRPRLRFLEPNARVDQLTRMRFTDLRAARAPEDLERIGRGLKAVERAAVEQGAGQRRVAVSGLEVGRVEEHE